MISALKKLNYILSCLLVGVLLVSTSACGETSKQEQESKEKHKLLLELFKQYGTHQELIELLEKVDDSSTSAESFKELTKKYGEQHMKGGGKVSKKSKSQDFDGKDDEPISGDENPQQEGGAGQPGTEVPEKQLQGILEKIKGFDDQALAPLANIFPKNMQDQLHTAVGQYKQPQAQDDAIKMLSELLKNDPQATKNFLKAINELQ